jgi:hypothetical protein
MTLLRRAAQFRAENAEHTEAVSCPNSSASSAFCVKPGRREIYVGRSAVAAIVANKVAPGLLDRRLANRPDDLWHDVPGDYAAHGRFDARAHDWSPQLWASPPEPRNLGTPEPRL